MKKLLFMLVMLAGVMQAVLWTSGDAGEAWSKEKATEMCARSDVAGVYICLGNVVDVVWKDESKGSTFYEPEGSVVNCLPVAPTDMGAECMQLMMPNYCTLDDNVCGYVAPEEFPGGETEGELIYDGTPVQPETTTPPKETTTQPTETPAKTTTEPKVAVEVREGGTAPAAVNVEQTLDTLILGVVGLGVLVLIVLYFVYRRTTGG